MLKDTVATKIWCLPQFLLFLIVRKLLKATYSHTYMGRKVYYFKRHSFFSAVALYHTLIPMTKSMHRKLTICHEHGHHRQGQYLGPFYLLIIGIISCIHNLIARISPKVKARYYNRGIEAWADRLGGITWVNGNRVLPVRPATQERTQA